VDVIFWFVSFAVMILLACQCCSCSAGRRSACSSCRSSR